MEQVHRTGFFTDNLVLKQYHADKQPKNIFGLCNYVSAFVSKICWYGWVSNKECQLEIMSDVWGVCTSFVGRMEKVVQNDDKSVCFHWWAQVILTKKVNKKNLKISSLFTLFIV